MRILEVIPDLNLAGAEVMMENLSYYLDKENTLKVVSMYDCDTAITRRMKSRGIDLVFLGKSSGFDISVVNRLRSIIREFRPDVIHTHLYILLYVILAGGLRSKRKIFHTVHNVAEKEVPKKLRYIQKIMFRTGKVVPVAISPLVKDSIVRTYGLREEQVPMIYNGVDLVRFSPRDSYEAHEPFTCIHIGRFSEQKNHDAMLMAMKVLSEKKESVRFIFLGQGELLDRVKKQAEDNGIEDRIEFAGISGDIRPWMDKADVFMLPSRWEGMPITLIEAMAQGMPIVASKVGGVPDMIEQGVHGLLIKPDGKELAEAILRLKEDGDLRSQLGQMARIRSKAFDLDTMGNEYTKEFQK